MSLPVGEAPQSSDPRVFPGSAASRALLAVAGCALPLKLEEEQCVLRTAGLTPSRANWAQIFIG